MKCILCNENKNGIKMYNKNPLCDNCLNLQKKLVTEFSKNKKKFNPECDEIINAGDIDEEGQLLIDEIIEYCKFKGTVKRIQTSAFNEDYLK